MSFVIPSTMDTIEQGKRIYVLTAHDRCDGCGARAYVRVTLDYTEKVLLFCGHHFHKGEAKLRNIAARIEDETDALLARD